MDTLIIEVALMVKESVILIMFACSLFGASALAQTSNTQRDVISTREMDRINWMEFRETVPARIQTVLLPTGTLEPHGVANNGADNTAPTAIAHRIARHTDAAR